MANDKPNTPTPSLAAPSFIERNVEDADKALDKNVKGLARGKKFDDVAKQVAESDIGRSFSITEPVIQKSAPLVAGGIVAVIGLLLLDPIQKATNFIFGGASTLLGKIPLIGGLLGEAVAGIGTVIGYGIPAIAGLIGYKMFSEDKVNVTPAVQIPPYLPRNKPLENKPKETEKAEPKKEVEQKTEKKAESPEQKAVNEAKKTYDDAMRGANNNSNVVGAHQKLLEATKALDESLKKIKAQEIIDAVNNSPEVKSAPTEAAQDTARAKSIIKSLNHPSSRAIFNIATDAAVLTLLIHPLKKHGVWDSLSGDEKATVALMIPDVALNAAKEVSSLATLIKGAPPAITPTLPTATAPATSGVMGRVGNRIGKTLKPLKLVAPLVAFQGAKGLYNAMDEIGEHSAANTAHKVANDSTLMVVGAYGAYKVVGGKAVSSLIPVAGQGLLAIQVADYAQAWITGKGTMSENFERLEAAQKELRATCAKGSNYIYVDESFPPIPAEYNALNRVIYAYAEKKIDEKQAEIGYVQSLRSSTLDPQELKNTVIQELQDRSDSKKGRFSDVVKSAVIPVYSFGFNSAGSQTEARGKEWLDRNTINQHTSTTEYDLAAAKDNIDKDSKEIVNGKELLTRSYEDRYARYEARINQMKKLALENPIYNGLAEDYKKMSSLLRPAIQPRSEEEQKIIAAQINEISDRRYSLQMTAMMNPPAGKTGDDIINESNKVIKNLGLSDVLGQPLFITSRKELEKIFKHYDQSSEQDPAKLFNYAAGVTVLTRQENIYVSSSSGKLAEIFSGVDTIADKWVATQLQTHADGPNANVIKTEIRDHSQPNNKVVMYSIGYSMPGIPAEKVIGFEVLKPEEGKSSYKSEFYTIPKAKNVDENVVISAGNKIEVMTQAIDKYIHQSGVPGVLPTPVQSTETQKNAMIGAAKEFNQQTQDVKAAAAGNAVVIADVIPTGNNFPPLPTGAGMSPLPGKTLML